MTLFKGMTEQDHYKVQEIRKIIDLMNLVIRLNAITFQQSEAHLRSTDTFPVNTEQGRH
jgi:hypothetical protein